MNRFKLLSSISILIFFISACGGGLSYQKSYDRILERAENQEDAIFLLNAYNAAITLQKLAEIAPQQAYYNNLVQFTRNNQDMHEKIVDRLEDAADDLDVKLPNEPSPLYQSHLTIMRNTQQENFDQEFVDFVSSLYETVYEDYKSAAVNANTEDVRVLAATYVSFQRDNLNQINNLAARLEERRN